jgi:23S rRNA (adenine1618-N6)-methyltransferase
MLRENINLPEKTQLHPRNKHRGQYNFKQLIDVCPELAVFVNLNKYNNFSVDFFKPEAVKMLNRALLMKYYGIKFWDIPKNYLCPPIPGRADYIHYAADLLGSINNGKIPVGSNIKCLDIGIGANCIYPIIGIGEYNWSFVGSDVDAVSIESAKKIIESNFVLTGKVELRLQPNSKNIFSGIIQSHDRFEITICNPPFHASYAEAQAGTLRKLSNLNHKSDKPVLNFGGQNAELWCEGGELKFVRNMVIQSRQFAENCLWFSTIISKQSNVRNIYQYLKKAEAVEVKTIKMGQGNKTSRMVAWTFQTQDQQQTWINKRWTEFQ